MNFFAQRLILYSFLYFKKLPYNIINVHNSTYELHKRRKFFIVICLLRLIDLSVVQFNCTMADNW
jgi:hypothetical protein